MAVLFVYGTLQHEPLLERLLGRVPASRPATLPAHRAAPLTGRAYPGLVVDEVAVAPGRLVDVTAAEVAVLDRFEGDQYTRTPVVAVDDEGEAVACEAWLLTGASRRLVADGAWDLDRFLARDVDAFLDGSTAGGPHPGAGS